MSEKYLQISYLFIIEKRSLQYKQAYDDDVCRLTAFCLTAFYAGYRTHTFSLPNGGSLALYYATRRYEYHVSSEKMPVLGQCFTIFPIDGASVALLVQPLSDRWR